MDTPAVSAFDCWTLDESLDRCSGNLTHVITRCSWSPFTTWTKNNQTTYKRTRRCSQISDAHRACSFCFGSSVEYQSSFVFLKGLLLLAVIVSIVLSLVADVELFEQSLLFPTRAHSTIRIISMVTCLSLVGLLTALVTSIVHLYGRLSCFSPAKTFRAMSTAQ